MRLEQRRIASGNYILTSYEYNAADGALLRIDHQRSTAEPSYVPNTDAISYSGTLTPLGVLLYSYDKEGRLIGKTRQLFDSSGDHLRTRRDAFAYDNLGRLIAESYDLMTLGGQHSRSYTYDATGNRTSALIDGATTVTYTYDDFNASQSVYHKNQLSKMTVSGVADETIFRYDTLGNLTETFTDLDNDQTFDTSSEEGSQYAWNIAGQLQQADVYRSEGGAIQHDVVQYAYEHNGTGQLMDRTVNNGAPTRFHWSGFSPYLEETGSGAQYNGQYAYFGDIRFNLGSDHQLDASDSAYYYLCDEAGNVIAVADQTGALTENFEYDAWGNDLAGNFASNSADIHYYQTGKYFDAVAGLYYNQARWYDPRLGSFLSESPISPMSEEEYVYCGNVPTNAVDINGLTGGKGKVFICPCNSIY